jgi:hypothetical protein
MKSFLVLIIFSLAYLVDKIYTKPELKEEFVSFIRIENLRLINHYRVVNIGFFWRWTFGLFKKNSDVLNCWNECDQDSDLCVAITFKNDDCYLYNKNYPILLDKEYTSFFKTYNNKNKQKVAIDCYVGKFGSWSPCNDNSQQQRERSILLDQHNGGILCPPLVELNNCSQDQTLVKGLINTYKLIFSKIQYK